jgi:hypothetical protein
MEPFTVYDITKPNQVKEATRDIFTSMQSVADTYVNVREEADRATPEYSTFEAK